MRTDEWYNFIKSPRGNVRVLASLGYWFGLGDKIRTGGAILYRVAPATVFGFGKGEEYSQTRWRFSSF